AQVTWFLSTNGADYTNFFWLKQNGANLPFKLRAGGNHEILPFRVFRGIPSRPELRVFASWLLNFVNHELHELHEKRMAEFGSPFVCPSVSNIGMSSFWISALPAGNRRQTTDNGSRTPTQELAVIG